MSYGERGESAKLWKQSGMTLEKVKSNRKSEAEKAAKALNAHNIIFFDLGDYPLEIDKEAKLKTPVKFELFLLFRLLAHK